MIEDPVIPQIKVSDIPPASVKKPKKGLLITLAILGIILIYSVISGLIVYGKAMSFKKTVNGLMTAGKSQDLVKIKQSLSKQNHPLKL